MTDSPLSLNRRQMLQALAATMAGTAALRPRASLHADEVPWLEDVQRPPAQVPRDGAGELEPLLVDEEGAPIRTPSRRRETRRRTNPSGNRAVSRAIRNTSGR